MKQTPVVYIVFNRPEHTRKTFEVLRKQRPENLFIIADGPRSNHPSDDWKCSSVREIVDKVDWPCEVKRNYAEKNLGLKKRISSGLDWVFESVDRAIVLEDDCVANPDFFEFCNTMLEHYSNDERISVVTGNNFQRGFRHGDASYYFSKFSHCWGWATWKRAWQHFDGDISFWPEWSKSDDWKNKIDDKVERRYWTGIFGRVRNGSIDSWAYPWTACNWYRGTLSVAPNMNLVSNIGFGLDGTHTLSKKHAAANLETHPLGLLKHPDKVINNVEADKFDFENHFGGKNLRFPRSILTNMKRLLRITFRFLRNSLIINQK